MSKKGGARLGAGRPTGRKNKATKEKEVAEAELRQKILGSINRLFNAQMALAEGVSYLYRIDQTKKGEKRKPVLVTSSEEIQQYLMDDVDSDSYYYISTERPDGRALDSMFNRVFGTPKQSMELSGEITEIVISRESKNDSKS